MSRDEYTERGAVDDPEERRARREARRLAAEERHAKAARAEQRKSERVQKARDVVNQGAQAVRRGSQSIGRAVGTVSGGDEWTTARDTRERRSESPLAGVLEFAKAHATAIAAIAGALLLVILIVSGVSRCSAQRAYEAEQARLAQEAAQAEAERAQAEAERAQAEADATPLYSTANPAPEFTHAGGLSMTARIAGVSMPDGYSGVKDPWVESGWYSTGDRELDQIIKSYCDGHAQPNLDFSDNAYNTYLQVVWAEYVERDNAQNPKGPKWMYEYAKQYAENDSGNCYEFAAFASFVLQYFGYDDAYPETCIVQQQSGNWGQHGLVFVTNWNGERSFCDSARGSNGWMLADGTYNYQVENIGQNIVDTYEYGLLTNGKVQAAQTSAVTGATDGAGVSDGAAVADGATAA